MPKQSEGNIARNHITEMKQATYTLQPTLMDIVSIL